MYVCMYVVMHMCVYVVLGGALGIHLKVYVCAKYRVLYMNIVHACLSPSIHVP